MARKSGLHKKVSSIFGDMPIPGNPPAGNTGMSTGSPSSGIDNRQYATPPAAQKTMPKVSVRLTEEQEYAASQRKKLFALIGLSCVFGIVLFFNFYKPQQATVKQTTAANEPVIASKNIEISWPDPGVWTSQIKDPMVRNSVSTLNKTGNEGTLTLRGIVGGSMALIGTEILNKGDEYQGWKVMEILKDSVLLEKPDGEKMELKMKNR